MLDRIVDYLISWLLWCDSYDADPYDYDPYDNVF